MPKAYPSIDYLRAIFDYCPECGILRWKHREDVKANVNSRFVGQVVGNYGSNGLTVRINYQSYSVHRIIYMIMAGEVLLEDEEIDHIDGNNANNSWSNLRKATRSQNTANRGVQINSRTEIKGVGLLPNGKYRARIDGAHLGCFDSKEEAINAYNVAANQIYGEYGRLSLLP